MKRSESRAHGLMDLRRLLRASVIFGSAIAFHTNGKKPKGSGIRFSFLRPK